MSLYVLDNGTFVPFVANVTESALGSLVCINDPFYAYTILAVVDLVAFCIPCFTRTTHPGFRAFLFALNLSLIANVVFAVSLNPSYGISWLFIGVVAVLGIALYRLAKEWTLFVTILTLLAAAFFNIQNFTQKWVSTLFGEDLDMSWVNVFIFTVGVITVVVAMKAKNLLWVEQLVDSFTFSVLAVFAAQYLNFMTYSHKSDAWIGTGFMPSPSQLCCDDNNVTCPIWFDWSSMFVVLLVAIPRFAYIFLSEDVEGRNDFIAPEPSGTAVPLLATRR